jgi:L-histidine N-alpha-methyltransferase
MNQGSGTVRIVTLEEAGDVDQMARDVRAGLLNMPKDLSPWPKYFYDAEGSRLFERITELPEYYQTRTELSILKEKAREIVARARCREIVELGSGSASKTRTLLDAMLEAPAHEGVPSGTPDKNPNGRPARYVPLDVSVSALRESGERLLQEYPGLEVFGYVGDFERSPVRLLRDHLAGEEGEGRRLVILLGGTIGNFTPERRQSFLSGLRAGLKGGDHLLIGVDLVKDPQVLEAAYDDGAGVTASFNKNLLKVINERLGGRFDANLFVHRASYDAEEARIEMWLRSTVEQEVRVSGLDLEVRFAVGEGMRTEISTKFTPGSVLGMFDEAGLTLLDLYTDDRALFGLALGRVEA